MDIELSLCQSIRKGFDIRQPAFEKITPDRLREWAHAIPVYEMLHTTFSATTSASKKVENKQQVSRKRSREEDSNEEKANAEFKRSREQQDDRMEWTD